MVDEIAKYNPLALYEYRDSEDWGTALDAAAQHNKYNGPSDETVSYMKKVYIKVLDDFQELIYRICREFSIDDKNIAMEIWGYIKPVAAYKYNG